MFLSGTAFRDAVVGEAKKRGARLPNAYRDEELDEESGRILAEVVRERIAARRFRGRARRRIGGRSGTTAG